MTPPGRARVVESHHIARTAFLAALAFALVAIGWSIYVLAAGGSWWGPLTRFSPERCFWPYPGRVRCSPSPGGRRPPAPSPGADPTVANHRRGGRRAGRRPLRCGGLPGFPGRPDSRTRSVSDGHEVPWLKGHQGFESPLGALVLFAEIGHRGSGFGPVAVTSRWGTQSSTWWNPSSNGPASSSTDALSESR